MKIAQFSSLRQKNGLGVVVNDKVLDVRQNAPFLSASIIDLITKWDDTRTILERVIKAAPELNLNDVKLHAPIAKPGKILCIAKNYAAHASEMKGDVSKVQNWFIKPATAINDPYAPVKMPVVSQQLDYEAELVVVIGKYGKNVPAERAMELVAGYMCGGDYTVRDWQKAVSNMTMGKGFDTHAPIGPWFVSADEIEDVSKLNVKCFVNGELRQSAPVADMSFPIEEQIAHLSKAMTLEPGDLIFTGTPSGVGAGFSPPKYLKTGDDVSIEIDQIGAIRTQIIAESGECVIAETKPY